MEMKRNFLNFIVILCFSSVAFSAQPNTQPVETEKENLTSASDVLESTEMYSCDVFLELSQKQDCVEKRREELEYLRRYYEDNPGDFIQSIRTEESDLANESTQRELQNKEVFDHLYEQIYYYRSGVFNYERKMN